ncbi:DUF38 domain-containing protein [Caenorhabditis elegans]|nr:DUF38 domain-containing protein [Caenorhabditis elegans]CAB07551.2 DUF38 domain-containing protein [Caenorhabditis elegans]|eukprot:NP_001122575.1 Uncharacterized protein CELE_C01B9.1 [Caenorhabditis elegans]
MKYVNAILAIEIPISYISIQFVNRECWKSLNPEVVSHVGMLLLEEMAKMLKSSNVKLKKFSVRLFETPSDPIEKILSDLDVKVLVLKTDWDEDDEDKKPIQKVESDNWKKVRALYINSFYLAGPVQQISHLSTASCFFNSINFDDLVFLKNHFLDAPHAREYVIHYREFDGHPMMVLPQKMGLITIVGDPIDVDHCETGEDIYKFHVMDENHDISINLCMREYANLHSITFTREPPLVKQFSDPIVTNYHSSTVELLENSQNISVFLVILRDSIMFQLTYQPKTSLEKQNAIFDYKKQMSGCSVNSENRTELGVNLDYRTLFCTHLKYLLDRIGYCTFAAFSFVFYGKLMSEYVVGDESDMLHMEFFNVFDKFVQPNSIKALVFSVNFKFHPLAINYITSVLSFFQPGPLQSIMLDMDKRTTAMNLESIVRLEQWEQAAMILMSDITVKFARRDFGHLGIAKIIAHPISFEDLTFLKEHFITSDIPQMFEIKYLRSSEINVNVAQKLLETFGPPAHEEYASAEQCDRIWCLPISNSENCVLVKHIFCRRREYGSFNFSRRLASELELMSTTSPNRSQILSALVKKIEALKNWSLKVRIDEGQVQINFTHSPWPTKSICYKNHREGCLLEYEFHKVVFDENFAVASCDDLNFVMNSVQEFDKFEIESGEISAPNRDDDPNNSNETILPYWLTNLKTHLKQRSQMLTVGTFKLNLKNHAPNNRFFSILSLIASETIELKTTVQEAKLKLKEINVTNAKEFKAESFQLSVPIKLLLHFSNVSATLQTVSIQDLNILKEHFLNSPIKLKFIINDTLSKNEDVNVTNLLEMFGAPDRIEDVLMEWRIRTLSTKFELVIEYRPCVPMGQSFTFESFAIADTVFEKEHQTLGPINNLAMLPLSFTTRSVILPSTLNSMKGAQLTEIYMSVERIRITIFFRYFLHNHENCRTHEYERYQKGCRVKCDLQEEVARHQDFISLAISHLSVILKSHDNMVRFKIYLRDDSEEDDVDKKVLQALVEALKERQNKLRIKYLEVYFWKRPLIELAASLLSWCDPIDLIRIVLEAPFFKGIVIEPEACELLVNLEQWKSVRQMMCPSLVFPTALSSFEHFSAANFTVPTISLEQLNSLKKHFMNFTTEFIFAIHFLAYKDQDINNMGERGPKPQDVFCTPSQAEYGNEELGNKRWYLPMENTEYQLDIIYLRCGRQGVPVYIFKREPLIKLHPLRKAEKAPPFDMLRLVTWFPLIMKNILNDCAFVSVEVLRNVSKDIRQFVDRNRRNSIFQTYDISLSLSSDDAKLCIRQFNSHTIFHYSPQPIGCKLKITELTQFGRFQSMRQLNMTDDTYINYLMRILQYILRDQRDCLNFFTYGLHFENDNEAAEARRQVKKILLPNALRSHKFQLVNLDLTVRNESEILELLECFDAGKLKCLILEFARKKEEETGGTIEINRIAEMDHWRNLEEFAVVDYVINADPLNFNQLFGHFKTLNVCLQNFTVDNLLFMKQKSLASSLYLHFICENFELENLYELIGRPLLETANAVKYRKWFFKLIGSIENTLILIIHTQNGKIHIQITRIPTSDVPQNATIRVDFE